MRLLPEAPEQKTLPPPEPEPPHPGRRRRGWKLYAFVALAAFLLLVFFFGYLPRRRRREEIVAQAERQARALSVANVTKVIRSPAVVKLLLPGNVTPITESYIYARASGYVGRRYADIGDRVKQGQVLADIEAPDLDAQVAQARASVAQSAQELQQAQAAEQNARAQEELARVTWERYSVLVSHGAVSRQDADTQLANYRAQSANVRLQQASIRTNEENVRANRANLERLLALEGFKQVRAPFDGVVTGRNFDVGALVSSAGSALGLSSMPLGGTQFSAAAGNAGASGTSTPQSSTPATNSPTVPGTGGGGEGGELYRLAQIDVLRVLVSVPQDNAATVRAGQPASVLVPQYVKHRFPGKITRTSESLDATARTLLAEVQVENHQRLLLPGMYAEAEIDNERPNPPLMVPGDAVQQTANGLVVAVLVDPTPDQRRQIQGWPEYRQQAGEIKRIHIQAVQVGRDYGPQIEITAGLQGWEYVVVGPGDRIVENALVVPRGAPPVMGQGSRQPQGPNEKAPAGGLLPSQSQPAPTGTPSGQGGAKGGGK